MRSLLRKKIEVHYDLWFKGYQELHKAKINRTVARYRLLLKENKNEQNRYLLFAIGDQNILHFL